jgi:hypothetical protein
MVLVVDGESQSGCLSLLRCWARWLAGERTNAIGSSGDSGTYFSHFPRLFLFLSSTNVIRQSLESRSENLLHVCSGPLGPLSVLKIVLEQLRQFLQLA